MVHLPGKHALSCAMREAAAMRGEESAQLRGNHASCRTLPSMPAPRTVSTASRAAGSTIDRRNFCARIWCAGRVYEMRDKCSDNRGARCAICRESVRGRLDSRRREPTGWLKEESAVRWWGKIPEPTLCDSRATLLAAIHEANRLGLTGVERARGD